VEAETERAEKTEEKKFKIIEKEEAERTLLRAEVPWQ